MFNIIYVQKILLLISSDLLNFYQLYVQYFEFVLLFFEFKKCSLDWRFLVSFWILPILFSYFIIHYLYIYFKLDTHFHKQIKV